MTAPSARDALLAFAEELDLCATRFGGIKAEAAFRYAAGLARGRADSPAEPHPEGGTAHPVTGESEGRTGDPGDAEPIVLTWDDLVADWRTAHPGACSCPGRVDPSCLQHGKGEDRNEEMEAAADAGMKAWHDAVGATHRATVTAILAAAAPLIRAGERGRLRALLGERFKGAVTFPGSDYLVDAVTWSDLLAVLARGEQP